MKAQKELSGKIIIKESIGQTCGAFQAPYSTILLRHIVKSSIAQEERFNWWQDPTCHARARSEIASGVTFKPETANFVGVSAICPHERSHAYYNVGEVVLFT